MKYFLTETNAKGIATVTMNRPPLNLWNYETYEEFAEIFRSLEEDENVNVIILKSNCKGFSAGNDINDLAKLTPENTAQHFIRVNKGINAFATCKKPTIAAIHGFALGTGMCMAITCDILVASEDSFFALPEATVGILGGYEFLRLFLPEHLARYYIYTGKRITAKTLFQFGAVNELVPKNEVYPTARRIAEEMLETTSPTALRCLKRSMLEADNDRLSEKYLNNIQLEKDFAGSYDQKESTSAFIEKRKPNFSRK